MLQYLIAVATSDGATSATPFTSEGLSGSEGSAASRSHSTRSADCVCATPGATVTAIPTAKLRSHFFMTAGCFDARANSRLQPELAQHRGNLRRSEKFQQPVGLHWSGRRRHPSCGKDSWRLQFPRDCTDDFDAGNLLQFADLLHGEIGLACEKPFGGKSGWNDRCAGLDFGRYPHPVDQSSKQDAAGADPRIGYRARAKQRRA